LLGHRNAHHAATPASALELATSLVGSTMSNERSSFALRSLRTGGEMWEPAVILLSGADREQLGEVESVAPLAGHGIGVVASAAPALLPDAPARLVAHASGWTLHAFGATLPVHPVGLSPSDLRGITAMIDDATEPLIDISHAGDRDQDRCAVDRNEPTVDQAPEPALDSARDRAVDSFVGTDHRIVVRLMGGVDVVSVDGEPGVFERSKTVELIAWLATHRERSTRTAARTALWELDVRDATFANVVSEARRALGRLVPPDDGHEWLARTLTEQLPLHSGVVTDAQLMEERLVAARLQSPAHAIETLRPAAELIRDMPFAGTSYLWPDAEGITSNLVLLATGVSTELAGHALSLGDTDLVFWATGQGLKVLPGHEELIALRMRAHARAGDLAGVRQEWESYERVVVADAWSDGEPAPKLLALRRELLMSGAG
jgi:two-component SAPR family response regulator